jgi:hypothetical protein
MTDTSWTIHTKGGTTIDTDYITTQPPEITRGKTVNFNLESNNLSLLQDYIEYAGEFETFENLNGIIRYTEDIPTNADVDSILLGIEPNADLDARNVFGVWGLIKSATDNRPRALTTNHLGLEVLVLAKYSDFADHTAVESELG